MVATDEEGETKMFAEINKINGENLCYYNRIVMEEILMIVHLRIRLCVGKMVKLDL